MSDTTSENTIARLREQLLLAQVRISELESQLAKPDPRVELERKLAEEAQALADKHLESMRNAGELVIELERVRGELHRIVARLLELDAQRRAMQQSRSWRWTAPIRSIERWWSGRR